jgi:HEAT repeat protein
MSVTSVAAALEALRAYRPEEIDEGLRFLHERLAGLEGAELRAATEAICTLFYVDTQDRPDLLPSLDLAAKALASVGPRIVSHLLELMQGSDIKSHFHLARTLGLIGRPALAALRRFIATEDDPYSRSFALFAVGKIRDPEVRDALPEVIGSLMHSDKEVRDSAARAVGKIAANVPAALVSELQRAEIFEALVRTLSDRHSAVRAKAVRSLGKVVRAGYLTPEREERVRTAILRILGRDEAFEWDRAYIVRREAEEALAQLEARIRSGAARTPRGRSPRKPGRHRRTRPRRGDAAKSHDRIRRS